MLPLLGVDPAITVLRVPAVRLLGPHAHDVLQLTVNHSLSGSLRDPPFLLGDPAEFRVITHRPDDDWLDLTVSTAGPAGGGR